MADDSSLSVELTIKSMQRQLLQIADRIPDDILLTLLKCFAQILTREPEQSSKVCGPFIRAFAKIRDDGSQNQFSAIIEEDEDQLKDDKVTAHNGYAEDDDNECSFNYKVSNVVTQEVVYSMGNNTNDDGTADENDNKNSQTNEEETAKSNNNGINGDEDQQNHFDENHLKQNEIYENGHCSHDNHDDYEMPNLLEPDEEIKLDSDDLKHDGESHEIIDEKFEEIASNQNVTDDAIVNESESHVEETIEHQTDNDITDESEKPQIDDDNNTQQQKEETPVIPMQKVTLDDIQREIHEMQMFLFNKGIASEVNKRNHSNARKPKKLEDAYKVDVCVNLKKKPSKSKAILSNYLNDHPHGKHSRSDKENMKARAHIFDPSVPNTPEDFLKEKSVTEKINKKKQKIKHLDVSWQKLCDSQNKVYKHSNFKPLNSEKYSNEPTIA